MKKATLPGRLMTDTGTGGLPLKLNELTLRQLSALRKCSPFPS